MSDGGHGSWPRRARALVDELRAGGSLRDDAWAEAFRAVPRHLFAPTVIRASPAGYVRYSAESDPEAWLTEVYSDTSLVVQHLPHHAGHRLADGSRFAVPTSSSTMPSLMARMIDALDIRPGMRVLEIGTGTGYNAAVLAERIGGENVVSIDMDPALVGAARERLARLGHHPVLVVGDGTAGVAAHAPFDRILATAAVPEIPTAWIHQLVPNGTVVANLRGELAGATCCRLERQGTSAEVMGPILPIGGHFMWMRPDLADPHRPHERCRSTRRGETVRTVAGTDPTAVPWDDPDWLFLLQLQLHGAISVVEHEGMRRVTAADGSEADVELRTLRVTQSGPRRLWDTVESTTALWNALGQPAPARFGVVANTTRQFVYLDSDDGWCRWPLPLV